MKIDSGFKERIVLWSVVGVGVVCVRSLVAQRRIRREHEEYRRWLQRRYQQNGRHVSFQSQHRVYGIPPALEDASFAKELRVAVELALAAGNNLVAYCEAKGTESEVHYSLSVTAKSQAEDFCTQVDLENEALIAKGLSKRFPTHIVIGEESTGTGTIPRLTDEPTWIIDPIDGTTNFAAGLPLSCVSIGFCVKGRPVLGVVYAPLTHELYLAVEGCGAYRNGHAIHVTQKRALKNAVVCAEFGYARGKEEVLKMGGALQSILLHGCRSVRVLGSGVLDICYVATGRLDVVYAGVASEGWKPWDYCAALVVATEAGCHVEAIDQEDGAAAFDLYSKSIICASSKVLVEETRQILRQEFAL